MPTVEIVHLADVEQREVCCRTCRSASATVHAAAKRRHLSLDGRIGVERLVADDDGVGGSYLKSKWFHSVSM